MCCQVFLLRVMCARDDRDQLVACPALHLHLPGRLLDGKPSFNALPAGLTKHTRWGSCTPLAGCEAQWQVVSSAAKSLRPTHWYAQWMTMTRCANVSIGLPVRGRGFKLPTLLVKQMLVNLPRARDCKEGRPARSLLTFFVDDNGLGESVSVLN